MNYSLTLIKVMVPGSLVTPISPENVVNELPDGFDSGESVGGAKEGTSRFSSSIIVTVSSSSSKSVSEPKLETEVPLVVVSREDDSATFDGGVTKSNPGGGASKICCWV